MLLLLRRLKRDLFVKNLVPKYAAYALGEVLLVVVGILIALQIDNWNDDREERATLQSYLVSIVGNIQEDLDKLHALRESRFMVRHEATNFMRLRARDRFEIEEIEFLTEFIHLCTQEKFFSPNTSGYDALKYSGVLDRLQGSDLERLLSRYYDSVSQVSRLERNHYELVRALYMHLIDERPPGLGDFAFNMPRSLSPNRLEELQSMYARTVQGPTMQALAESQRPNHMLMLHYDSLTILGRAFIRMVEDGQMNMPEAQLRTPIDDWNEDLGFAALIIDGRPALEAYELTVGWGGATFGGAPPFRFDSFQIRGGELHIYYAGGPEWAFFTWIPAGQLTAGSPTLDFSRFSTLYLELKGDRGGETISVSIKDFDYPRDRPPIVVDLVLSEDWQSYEIDLRDFEPIDWTRVNTVLAFLISAGEDALGFSIRDARFE
jgi:hypothetical protein